MRLFALLSYLIDVTSIVEDQVVCLDYQSLNADIPVSRQTNKRSKTRD